ncbi:MAG: VanZ family protein [Clostridia bacterium]|nr:VanZ family protein [Clostridia bacterium]
MKNKIRQLIILSVIILTVLCLAFIFGNSLKDGAESGEQSMAVKRMLLAIADFLGIEGNINLALLRNLAHVAEFCLLGLCIGSLSLYLSRRKYPTSISRYSIFLSASIGTGVLIAIVDELIQLGSAGRACEIKDVLLDVAGIVVGNILAILFYFIIIKLRNASRRAQK